MEKYIEMFKEGMTKEEFKLIVEKVNQASGDKVRTEYATKIKDLEGRIPQEKDPQVLELEERLKAIELKEHTLNMKESLSNAGLPSELGKYLNSEVNIEDLKGVFGEMKLGNSFKPEGKPNSDNVGMTKEQFHELDYNGRSELYNTNPDLYNILNN